ncbi:signal peptide containing protein [Theileria equi strain WA]|uniref:Signal peptide containing protein n=1 Tax=Theileria equi strain WA TaxID=1537102 RepID=L1LDF7_THEEQ|nr:signal peptide containing protein [Theileria equi strain WA]EKX73381.1 signal peptide containing protein [Theileria equi strain WA]|eukprot:XP_004832833.1 signal peptide containing protein [Theileria equi strain WA]
MKALTLLYSSLILSILSPCICGDNNPDADSKKGSDDISIHKYEAIDLDEVSNFTIDLSSLNEAIHRTYEYYHDGNYILLLIPQRNILVTKVVNGTEDIWNAGGGVKLEYAKVYLKDFKPQLILITESIASCATWTWYLKDGSKWKDCKERYDEEIDKLRLFSPKRFDFILDTRNTNDSIECKKFEADILGAPVMLYFTKPNYLATDVRYGKESIWKATGDEKCVACDLYSSGDRPFIVLVIKNRQYKTLKYFERIDEKWLPMVSEEFNKKLLTVRKVHPKFGYNKDTEQGKQSSTSNTQDSCVSVNTVQKSWWSGCIDILKAGITPAAAHYFICTPPGLSYAIHSKMLEEDEQEEVRIDQANQRLEWRRIDEASQETLGDEFKKKND